MEVWAIHRGGAMTKVHAVVRLIPGNGESVGAKQERQYCAQMLIPGEGARWRNVGHLILAEEKADWIPLGEYAALMPRIGVLPGSKITGDDEKSAPYAFAMYKINLYIEKILGGEYVGDEVVPPNFSDVDDEAEAPFFIGAHSK